MNSSRKYHSSIPTATATLSTLDITINNDNSIIEKASKSPKRIIDSSNQSSSSSLSFLSVKLNEDNTNKFLKSHEWPDGLIKAFIRSCKKIPIRYFICDDSGSMLTNDGHKCIKLPSSNDYKMVKCSRWSELVNSLTFYSHLAATANAPTEFRLLNMCEPIMIGASNDDKTLNAFLELLSESPGGQTPICAQIRDVIEKIRAIKDVLIQNGQKACVVIATDGEATDGDLIDAMRALEQLPVWVVVRLCTDEQKVVDYWNSIDSELELEMDVLDDLEGESEEVYENQKGWLNYDEKLHRFREFGAIVKELDLLDEALLSSDQMVVILKLLLPIELSLPHPEENWIGFLNAVNNANKQDIWCPRTKKMKKYIDMNKIKQLYGNGRSSSTCSIC